MQLIKAREENSCNICANKGLCWGSNQWFMNRQLNQGTRERWIILYSTVQCTVCTYSVLLFSTLYCQDLLHTVLKCKTFLFCTTLIYFNNKNFLKGAFFIIKRAFVQFIFCKLNYHVFVMQGESVRRLLTHLCFSQSNVFSHMVLILQRQVGEQKLTIWRSFLHQGDNYAIAKFKMFLAPIYRASFPRI